jgi:hypothetical protein
MGDAKGGIGGYAVVGAIVVLVAGGWGALRYQDSQARQRAEAARAHAEYRAKTFGEEIPSGSRTVVAEPATAEAAKAISVCEQVTVGMFQRDEGRDGVYEFARECLAEVGASGARSYCRRISTRGSIDFCSNSTACARAHGAMASACAAVR